MSKNTKAFDKTLTNQELSIPIYSPRTSYNNIRTNDEILLQDLALNFDPFTINILKNEFKVRNGSMTIVDFVLILKEHLLNWQTELPFREKKLIRVLIMLFDEIDLNGNGLLEWDEFTNYIIEKATVLNNIKNKTDEVKNYTPAYLKVGKKFQNLLMKAIYIEEIDRVAILEEGSDEIIFVNHETGAIHDKKLLVRAPPDPTLINKVKEDSNGDPIVRAEKAMILDMLYIRDKNQNFLMTSSNDGAIRTWRNSGTGFVLVNSDEEETYYPKAQVVMAWDETNQILYTGQRDGVINIWDKKSDTILDKLDKERGGHDDVITDIVPMPKLQLVATCSLDKKIILWSTIEPFSERRTYREHTLGVVSMTFNESLILLVSAGNDHQICVWNPYIGRHLKKFSQILANAIFKISAHNFPLINVQYIEGSSHFVSLDNSGIVKVWDFKKFNCIQTFSIETEDEKHKFHPQRISYIPSPLKLMFCGRTLSVYEYDKNYNPNSVDDAVVVAVCYRSQNNTIITPAGNKIKVWNALNGEVKKIFSDINTTSEITYFTLDYYKKRCLVGFANGETAVYNVLNGAKLKSLTKHESEVNFIVEARNLSVIITASSSDRVIKFNQDIEVNESEHLKTIIIKDAVVNPKFDVTKKAHPVQFTDRTDHSKNNKSHDSKKSEEAHQELENAALTALKYLEDQKMLITGLQSGNIAFWEAETAKYIGSCTPFGNEEITNLCPVADIDYVIASTALGKIGIIACPPLPYRYTKVLQWVNQDPETKTPSFVNYMIWSDMKRLLFTADERSFIRVFDLTQVIEQIRQDRKAKQIKDDQGSKFRISAPLLGKEEPPSLWVMKAHNEPIRAIEYVETEDLLLTSGLDKKVKLWDAKTGKLIDSLQQKYDKFDPVPISYKKPGFEGIWAPNLFDRVDKEYLTKKRQEEMEADEKASENPFTKLMNAAEAQAMRENSKPLEKINPLARNHLLKGAQNLVNPLLKGALKLIGKNKTIPQLANILTKQKSIISTESEIDLNDPKIGQLLKHISETSPWLLNDPKKAIIEAEKEEFDPFYNYAQVETKELPSSTSTQWKLRVQFEENKKEFDSKIREIINKVDEAERQVETKEKKEGLMNKMEAFQADDQQQNVEEKPEEVPSILKKEKERVKATNENMKSVLTAHKQGHIMKGAIVSYDDAKFADVKSKLYSDLHRKELKGKMLDKNKPVVALSKDEVDAAYKLAAALSNYDKDDLRNLKFLEIQTKQVNEKEKSQKNFISLNREKVQLMTSPTKK